MDAAKYLRLSLAIYPVFQLGEALVQFRPKCQPTMDGGRNVNRAHGRNVLVTTLLPALRVSIRLACNLCRDSRKRTNIV
jgi:hypothetical protein